MEDRTDAQLVSQRTSEYRVNVLPRSVIWERLQRDSFALCNSEGSTYLLLYVTEPRRSVVTLSPGKIVLKIIMSMHVYLLLRNHGYLSSYKCKLLLISDILEQWPTGGL